MNVITNPHMLPKIRSKAILDAIGGKVKGFDMFPCEMQIATFVPGLCCAAPDTVIPAHVGNLGKGTSTKVSDHGVCATCLTCHDLYDRRHKGWEYLADHCSAAVLERVLLGTLATQARLIGMGLIVYPRGELT